MKESLLIPVDEFNNQMIGFAIWISEHNIKYDGIKLWKWPTHSYRGIHVDYVYYSSEQLLEKFLKEN
jgi:hypothetical protein